MNLFSNKLNWSERRMILQNENIFDLCEKFNVNFNPIFYKVLNQDKEYDRLTNEGDFQFVISGFPNTYKSSFCSSNLK